LFNLAQTFRQMGDCKQAAFFYKRFLALKEQDTKKPIKPELKIEVEKRIGELEECMKREIASKPPTSLDGGGTATGGTATGSGSASNGTQTATGGGDGGEDGGEEDGEDDGVAASDRPSLMALRLAIGAGKLGAGDLDTKVQVMTALIGGYPLWLGDKLRLDVGAGLTFTPVPFNTSPPTGMSENATSKVIGIFANAGPTFMATPKIGLRADIGVGVQLFTGLGRPYSPFTEAGGAASGALSSVLVRMALSGDYAVTPNLVVTLTPIAFSYAPAPDGFDSGISSLTTASALAGISYQR
jgi:hypothetical protein